MAVGSWLRSFTSQLVMMSLVKAYQEGDLEVVAVEDALLRGRRPATRGAAMTQVSQAWEPELAMLPRAMLLLHDSPRRQG